MIYRNAPMMGGFVARLGTEPRFPGPREDHPTG
jgi:hypothetical protein